MHLLSLCAPDGRFLGAVEATAPEIRRALASFQNALSLLLLLLLHYIVTHILAIATFSLGTTLLVGLDRRLRAHADAQVCSCVLPASSGVGFYGCVTGGRCGSSMPRCHAELFLLLPVEIVILVTVARRITLWSR